VRRPRQTTISPDYFSSGEIGHQTAQHDEYFATDSEPTIRIILDNFVSRLPEYQKSAVEMCVMAGMTYEEAAGIITIHRGKFTHKKTVWRWAQQGVVMLGNMFKAAGWATAISPKVPDCE
jgi:DNA-directed RNA polymerase specialized sigma24 family protein